jgi:hypothetical protein
VKLMAIIFSPPFEANLYTHLYDHFRAFQGLNSEALCDVPND